MVPAIALVADRVRAHALALLRCRKAATISEYGLLAILVVTAAGAAQSPRLHPVKDAHCPSRQAACEPPRRIAAAQRRVQLNDRTARLSGKQSPRPGMPAQAPPRAGEPAAPSS